jgi:hypothetical protein
MAETPEVIRVCSKRMRAKKFDFSEKSNFWNNQPIEGEEVRLLREVELLEQPAKSEHTQVITTSCL